MGLSLCNFGSLLFLLIFQFKLHQIKDSTTKNNLRQIKVAFFIIVSFGILWEQFGHGIEKMVVAHVSHIIRIAVMFILLPKYYINQNLNLKLYVSVYHHQPPPVLPWQLTDDFDHHNGTKLITVNLP